MLRGGRGWRRFAPFRAVPQHGPATHQQFSRQRHDRLLSARLLAPGEPLHQPLGPRVVTQQDPARFDQHLSQQRRPAATDAASAIGLARLKLFGHQSCISRDLPPILKPLWVVQVGHDHLRRATSNAGDRPQQLDALVRRRKRFELAFHFAQQLGDRPQRLQLEGRFATPELLRRAFLQGLGKLLDHLESGHRPGSPATIQQNALALNDGAEVILDRDAPSNQGLPILEQRSTLTRFGCRDMDRRELFERRELGQLESVVAVGLALHVLPLPSFAAGIGDLTLHAPLAAQIVHPTSDRAGLDDYQVGAFLTQ